MGLGDFVHGVGEAVTNVGKAAAWTANPTHWDDIGRGVGNAAEFVVEHPGQTWDMGFEMGRTMLKDQLDPVNLAINAGLIGLTVATGGAAAPAFIAKMGLGAKSVQAGVEGLKVADTAADVVKGVKSGVEAVQVATDLSRGQKFVKGAQEIASGIKESSGFERLDNVLNAGRELKGVGREAMGLSRYGGMAERRAGMAEKVLGEAGEGAGFMRQRVARSVGGTTNPLNPVQSGKFANMNTRFDKIQSAIGAPSRWQDNAGDVSRGVEIAADPEGAAMDYAGKRMNAQMLQPSQMPSMPTVASSNQEASTVQGMDWSSVGASGGAAGRTQSYGPGKGYDSGRGFNTPNSVDWGSVMPSTQEAYA